MATPSHSGTRGWARWLLAAAVLVLVPAVPVRAAEPVTLSAVMIHASNRPAPLDRRIENIEYKLRKIFKFEHYRHAGQGALTVGLPGSGAIRLGDNHLLQVNASDAGKGRIRTQIKWTRGGTTLLTTTTLVQRGAAPTVIGGPSQGDGKLIVTLSVR